MSGWGYDIWISGRGSGFGDGNAEGGGNGRGFGGGPNEQDTGQGTGLGAGCGYGFCISLAGSPRKNRRLSYDPYLDMTAAEERLAKAVRTLEEV